MGRWPAWMTLLDRFEAQYIPEPNCGCWLWIGADRGGEMEYGQIVVDGRPEAAHRVSWTLFRGPIPAGLNVLHHCDVGCCVNPTHLFLGTLSDNMIDMVMKGRNRGAVVKTIPAATVVAIRAANGSSSQIAKQFGVGAGYVRELRLGSKRRTN